MSRSYKHNPGGRNCGSGPPGYGKWVRRRDHKRFRARWRQALIYGASGLMRSTMTVGWSSCASDDIVTERE